MCVSVSSNAKSSRMMASARKKLLFLLGVGIITLIFLHTILSLHKEWLVISKALEQLYKQRMNNHSMNFIEREAKKNLVCNATTPPHKSIFYIKVHKTGSTTLRSILLSYGMKHDLTICMDPTNLWGLNWPYQIDETKLTKLYDEKCDLVAEELVYNQAVVQRLMKSDVYLLTSVRHPVEHFLSLYHYSNIHNAVERLVNKMMDKWEGIRLFLKNPKLVKNVYATYGEKEIRDKLQLNMIEPNLQLFSLGIRSSQQSVIEKTVSELDFITVAEKWDESMVVLKKKLCWDYADVVYQKQNVRRPGKKEEVPVDVKNAILKFNEGDLWLYNVAHKRLLDEIKNIENFEFQLEEYKKELVNYEERCLKEKDTCPPVDSGSIGHFVELIRKHQQTKLLAKLRETVIV